MSKMDEPDLEPKWTEPVGQMGVLAFIKSELAAGHPFPTAPKIADQFGWSNGSASDVLMRLKKNGHLVVVSRNPHGRGWKYTYGLAKP